MFFGQMPMSGHIMEFHERGRPQMAKKKTTKKAIKKRNPNDATFRNIQALKRRLNRLELRVSALEEARATLPVTEEL